LETLLNRIIAMKKAGLEKEKRKTPIEVFMKAIEKRKKERSRFKQAIAGKGEIKLIAEIKRKSPTAGLLRDDFDIRRIAGSYSKYADAVSVVTERHFFGGDVEFIKDVKKESGIPLLRKDFMFDIYQIYESAYFGADAVLLIASILEKEDIKNLIKTSIGLGMDVVAEVHNKKELNMIMEFDAIIGINNRNLEDFRIDFETTKKLAKMIPKERVVISESGIKSRGDIEELKGMVDAVLVGSCIMKSEDIEEKLRELKGHC